MKAGRLPAAFALILLLASQSAEVIHAGLPAAAPICDCWYAVGQPVYLIGGQSFEVDVTYHNGFDQPIIGTVNLTIRNSLNQTVGTDATTGTLMAGENGTFHPSVSKPLPPGTYSTLVFATDGGRRISNVTQGSFVQRYSLVWQGGGFSSGGGPISASASLTNVSPQTVRGTLSISAVDISGNVFSTVAVNFTVLANSTYASPDLAMPGTEAISYCFISQFTLMALAPNGSLLAPRDREVGADCPGFGFPMTQPIEATIGAFTALRTNVTNVAPFSTSVVVVGFVRDSNRSLVAVASFTVTLDGGKTATGYLATAGLPCGNYTVHFTDAWVAQVMPPPEAPNFMPSSFDAALRVC